MRFVTTLALTVALSIGVLAPATAQEVGDVGCATVSITDTLMLDEIIELDEGVTTAVVGHFLWVSFSPDNKDSYENNVSTDITGMEGQIVTICTDYVPGDVVIPTGPGTAYEVHTVEGVRVIVSSVEPHPTIAHSWITDSGLTIA